ncbi:GNAT family N-acetyltransferase [Erythrobacter sp. KY5]|uniref:GNAT family N-acetyltransferase n=1 Tax=Erythrobacter sp. KY5 TaxID=2011159 RepID=UPI000DBEF8E8|nr:GNAT family N-acetyltransferase [Erythrobacter sp. KY5]AWW75845.1 GNAT family N-acetyltransferase [Erythrobacter sp. KY5]
MQPVTVVRAGEDRREAVVRTITLGFATDPVARWVWPDPATYLEIQPQFVDAFGGNGFAHDSVYETQCGRAAAMWLPPEVEPDGERMQMLAAQSVAPERMEEIGAFMAQMDDFHPAEPCWYLPMIAADPFATGQGLGAALMKHALAVVDESGMPAYLESSNPRNISLYERHGFEAIGEIQHGSSPVMTPMVRAARA